MLMVDLQLCDSDALRSGDLSANRHRNPTASTDTGFLLRHSNADVIFLAAVLTVNELNGWQDRKLVSKLPTPEITRREQRAH